MENSGADRSIRRKKDRKIQKHVSALIDGEAWKVANYRVKQEAVQGERIEFLEVISKFRVEIPLERSVRLKIEMDKKRIDADVVWHHGLHEPGSFIEVFRIIEKYHAARAQQVDGANE